MFLVLNEKNEGVFQGEEFMEAANIAIAMSKKEGKSFAVVQQIWNTMMLLEEEEIIEGMVEVA